MGGIATDTFLLSEGGHTLTVHTDMLTDAGPGLGYSIVYRRAHEHAAGEGGAP